MFVVGDYVLKWLPKWASQLKTIMSDPLRLRNGKFPFQNWKGCEMHFFNKLMTSLDFTCQKTYKITLYLCFYVNYSQINRYLDSADGHFGFPMIRVSQNFVCLALYLKSISTPLAWYIPMLVLLP